MRVVIITANLQQFLRVAKGKVLSAAAMTLRTYVCSKISIDGPPRSKPGQYPRRDTTMLWRTLKVTIDRDANFADVGSNMFYAAHLEKIRPFLRRGLSESALKIKAAINKVAR